MRLRKSLKGESFSASIRIMPETTRRYVALFDILGFSEIVANGDLSHVAEVMNDLHEQAATWQGFLEKVSEVKGIQFRLFSDTLLAYSLDESVESLHSMINFSQMVVGGSLVKGVVLRGAITNGETIIDGPIFLGEPIVRAYRMEQQQEWAGCWVDNECVNNAASEMKGKAIVSYPIPLKTGIVEKRWAVNWTWIFHLFPGQMAIRVKAAFSFFRELDPMSWSVQRKLDNTLAFAEEAFTLIQAGSDDASA